MGQEAQGGTRETKTICKSGPVKSTGAGEAEGTAHQTTSALTREILLVPGRLLKPRSWGLLQAGSLPARYLETPSEERDGDQKGRISSRGYQAFSFSTLTFHLCPPAPLTRMQAATTSAAVATRLFPALTSAPASPHQLSFQH